MPVQVAKNMSVHHGHFVKAGVHKLLLKLTEYDIIHLLNLKTQISFLLQVVLLSSKNVIRIQVSKHPDLLKKCIACYIYTYQLQCTKQDVLRTLINVFYLYANEAKHTSMYALLLKRHPCRFWLGGEQSPKNN